jgi:carlactone synthase/all-trans-10'-apo-beta-carotenal 13,14-cleaving dioxygenase
VYRQDPATLQRTEIAFIADRNPLAPAWVHDFAISEHYAIICETPLYFSMPSLVLGTSTDYTFMDWKPQDGTRVHVVPLDGSGVRAWLDHG